MWHDNLGTMNVIIIALLQSHKKQGSKNYNTPAITESKLRKHQKIYSSLKLML